MKTSLSICISSFSDCLSNLSTFSNSDSRKITAWKSAKAALRIWPSLWVKGAQVAARAEADSRVARVDQIYGVTPMKKLDPEDLEEVERRASGKDQLPQRPLPSTPNLLNVSDEYEGKIKLYYNN